MPRHTVALFAMPHAEAIRVRQGPAQRRSLLQQFSVRITVLHGTLRIACVQTHGRSDGWMDRRTNGWYGWTDGRMDGRTDGRTDGWMDGMDGRMGHPAAQAES